MRRAFLNAVASILILAVGAIPTKGSFPKSAEPAKLNAPMRLKASAERLEEKEPALNELASFDDASFYQSRGLLHYSAKINEANPILKVSSSLSARREKMLQRGALESKRDAAVSKEEAFQNGAPGDAWVNVDYLSQVGLMYVDVFAKDDAGEIQQATFHEYPFHNEKGEVDAKWDILGDTFTLSSLRETYKTSLNAEPNSSSTLKSPFGGGISDDGPQTKIPKAGDIVEDSKLIPPLIKISSSLVGFEEASDVAFNVCKVPNLKLGEAVDYLFHLAKVAIIREQFNQNSKNAKQPNGLINDQKSYSSWKFGMSNVAHAGCECIALYNMMFDAGATVDLPSVIASVELANADLLLGLWGTNAVSPAYENYIENIIKKFFEDTLLPKISYYIDDVAQGIFDYHYKTIPALLRKIGIVLGMQVRDIAEKLIAAVAKLTAFIAHLQKNKHTLYDVASYAIGSVNLQECEDLSSFESGMATFRQGIVSFWNTVNSDGSIEYFDGMHTVYVKRCMIVQKMFQPPVMEYRVYNYYSTGVGYGDFDSISAAIRNDTSQDAAINYLWGGYLYEC